MTKARGKNYSVYLTADVDKEFDLVKQHIGYGTSETIANLIHIKANEIKDGVTRRQLIEEIRGDLARIEGRLDFFVNEIRPKHGIVRIEQELAEMKLMLRQLLGDRNAPDY